MSGNSKKKKTRTMTEAEDEVEQLLRVAEDDVLLKLSVNSHLKSDYAINPDLDHRFQALKSRGTKKPNFNRKSVPPNSSSSSSSAVDLPNQPAATTGDVDDLFARFAALKGTLPCYSSSSTTTTTNTSSSKNLNSEEADDDEDEVDKVIRWAVDAARLDPSPSSDDDDDNDDDDTDSDDDGDESEDSGNRRQKIK